MGKSKDNYNFCQEKEPKSDLSMIENDCKPEESGNGQAN